MKQTVLRPFEDSVANVRGRTILLDVDGTLLPDGTDDVGDAVRDAVARLRLTNTIYMVSNGHNAFRVARLAEELMVEVAPAGTPAGKPFARAARDISFAQSPLVIGDKYITDGLFAYMLGASFLYVRSKRSGAERLAVRLSYMIENVVAWFL